MQTTVIALVALVAIVAMVAIVLNLPNIHAAEFSRAGDAGPNVLVAQHDAVTLVGAVIAQGRSSQAP
jgi:hypothetical protein